MEKEEKILILAKALINLSVHEDFYKDKIRVLSFLKDEILNGENESVPIINELKSWAIKQGFNVEFINDHLLCSI